MVGGAIEPPDNDDIEVKLREGVVEAIDIEMAQASVEAAMLLPGHRISSILLLLCI